MNTTTATSRHITTHQTTMIRARRAGAVSVAGALACLTLAPAIAHADQVTAEGGSAFSSSSDIDEVVAVRKERMARYSVESAAARSDSASRSGLAIHPDHVVNTVCDIPESLDAWTRRLIALQVCAKAHGAQLSFRAPAMYGELASSVGHCGHEALHQPPAASSLPVSYWYTPTSC